MPAPLPVATIPKPEQAPEPRPPQRIANRVKANAIKVMELRAEKNWTRHTLSSRSSVCEKTITRIEQGNVVRFTTLAAVAKAFDVDTLSLVDEFH